MTINAASKRDQSLPLAEGGPTMRLPRRTELPRNVGRYALRSRPDGNSEEEVVRSAPGWDILDYLAVLGLVASLAGLVLALWPATRSGGVLVPVGLGLMAIGAYAARRRDGTTS